MVSATVVHRFGANPEPVAPEDWRDGLGPDHELAQPPRLGHIVTNQPLTGPSHLLFVRGDTVERALTRLASIKEDPNASRFQRTTEVPLLDELIDLIGVEVQHKLAELVLAGGLKLEAVVLEGLDEPPEAVARFEAAGELIPGGKARRRVILAAVSHLAEIGIGASRISLRGTPLGKGDREGDVLCDWGSMSLYRTGEFLRNEWYSLVFFILGSHRKGPWIALECSVRSKAALEEAEDAEAQRLARQWSEHSSPV